METARIFEKSEVKRSFFEIVNNTACSALNYDSRLFLSDFFFCGLLSYSVFAQTIHHRQLKQYRGADKSLARPGRK
jgi:hypothetical protein